MAKVTAPFFSFSASQQIAKILVFFTWKGINVVRKYVIPANPNTAAQQVIRGYFANAVTEYHTADYDADDKLAWNRYAGTLSRPMSGFNAFLKAFVDILVGGAAAADMGFDGSLIQSGAGQMDASIEEDGAADGADLVWGYSKTALIYTQALGELVNVWSALNIAATSGARVYGRFNIKLGVNIIGKSGLFQVDIL